jgi:chemotaxis protein methyltransferase CheR
MEAKLQDDLAKAITDTITESILILDQGLRVIFANRSFYDTFHVDARKTEGKLIYELGNGQWNIPELKNLLSKILPKRRSLRNFEVNQEFSGIGRKVMLLNARRLRQQKKK